MTLNSQFLGKIILNKQFLINDFQLTIFDKQISINDF